MGFKGLCGDGDGGRRGWEGEYGGKSRDANFLFTSSTKPRSFDFHVVFCSTVSRR